MQYVFFVCLLPTHDRSAGAWGKTLAALVDLLDDPPVLEKISFKVPSRLVDPVAPDNPTLRDEVGRAKLFFDFVIELIANRALSQLHHTWCFPHVFARVFVTSETERWIQQVSQKHVHSGQIRPGGQRQLCVFPQCKAHNPWVCGEARYPGVGHHTRDDTWRRLWKLGCKEYKTSRPMLVRLCITCRDEAAMRERIWLAHWFKWQTIQNRQDFISHKVHLRHGLPLCINRWYQHIDSWHLWLHLHVTWRKGSIQWDETSGCHLWGASPWRSDETTNQKVMATCWVFFSACVCHGNVRSFSGCWSRCWNLPCKQNRKPLGGLPFCEGAMLLQQEYPEIHAFIGFSGLWLHWPEFEAHPTGRGCHWVMCLVYFVCHTALLGTGNTQCYLRHVCNIQLHPLY